MSWLLYRMAFRDLFNNRKKSVLALLAILVGMIAFGTMLFSNELITNEITTTYSSINPSSATLNVDKVDERMIKLTKEFEGITGYETKSFHQLRGKDAKGNWKTVELFSAENYANLRINKVFAMDGKKNPKKDEMLIERDAMLVADKGINDTLTVQLPNKVEKKLSISGVVNDISVHPATMHNTIYAYVSPETLLSMGLSQNRMDIKVSGDAYDREHIVAVSNDYMRMLESNGYQIKNVLIDDTPGVSMHLEEYKTALFLLRTFAFIALAFSCLIMSSLITSIFSQLVKQMGILKSFGAKSRQIVLAYLAIILLPIVAASGISLPISQLLARLISEKLLRISNLSLVNQSVPLLLSGFFIGLMLILPIGNIYPSISKGTKVTIRKAFSGVANDNIEGKNLLGTSFFERPTRLSIRNAFRKKSRLVMNVATLTMSGICFITVLIAMLSVQSTLNTNLDSFDYEYRFLTSSKEDTAAKEKLASMKKIQDYEMWGSINGKYLANGDNQDKTYSIMGLPKENKFIRPDMMEGEWLSGLKSDQIVVSHGFINKHPRVKLGDKVSLDMQGQKATFTIGGVMKDLTGATIYMKQEVLDKTVSTSKQQRIFQATLNSKAKRRERVKMIHQVEEKLLEDGISILQSETKSDAASILSSHYMPTFQTLLIVIVMVAVVSGFGLASTTNIQTLERVKEIGIMKSFGATRKQILKLITAENLFITLLSWVLAAVLSIPAILLSTDYFSKVTLEAPIQLSFFNIVLSYVIWLIVILIIGRRASKKPASRAAKMTIKACLISE